VQQWLFSMSHEVLKMPNWGSILKCWFFYKGSNLSCDNQFSHDEFLKGLVKFQHVYWHLIFQIQGFCKLLLIINSLESWQHKEIVQIEMFCNQITFFHVVVSDLYYQYFVEIGKMHLWAFCIGKKLYCWMFLENWHRNLSMF